MRWNLFVLPLRNSVHVSFAKFEDFQNSRAAQTSPSTSDGKKGRIKKLKLFFSVKWNAVSHKWKQCHTKSLYRKDSIAIHFTGRYCSFYLSLCLALDYSILHSPIRRRFTSIPSFFVLSFWRRLFRCYHPLSIGNNEFSFIQFAHVKIPSKFFFSFIFFCRSLHLS